MVKSWLCLLPFNLIPCKTIATFFWVQGVSKELLPSQCASAKAIGKVAQRGILRWHENLFLKEKRRERRESGQTDPNAGQLLSDRRLKQLSDWRIMWSSMRCQESYLNVPESLQLFLGLQSQSMPASREGSWESMVIPLGIAKEDHPAHPNS